MIPTSALNPLGQVFERQFIRAWELFQQERFDEANAISIRLVKEPLIGDLHKAGCHLILAHSPDNYVWHAEQALVLFRGLYPDPKNPPDAEQKRSQDELVKMAENVLAQAMEDARAYAQTSKTIPSQNVVPLEAKRLNTHRLRSILESRKAV